MNTLIDWNDEATWWFSYRTRLKGPARQWVTYGRSWVRDAGLGVLYQKRANYLDSMLPTGPGLVVGCGFGFLIEAMANAGRTDAWGADTSAWIHANIASETRADVAPRILDKDARDADAVAFFAAAVGAPFTWIVTEEMLSSYPDSDIPAWITALDAFGVPVIHFVAESVGPPFHRRTGPEWRAFAPSHSWHASAARALRT